MRAHEQAVRTGFTATIWRDKIMEELLLKTNNPEISEMMKQFFKQVRLQKDKIN